MDGPTVDAEARGANDMAGTRRSSTHRLRRWLWRLAIAILVILLLPLVLTLFYRVPAVHPISTLMLVDAATGKGYERQWTPLEELGDRLAIAVIMSEDGKFCSHDGVDWSALNTVINDALSGDATRGASTITMQTVKNLFLWGDRSYVRKAIEVPLALYFDFIIPKRRIMEIYLNIAEWGPGIYGAEAASQLRFGKSASRLTRTQAALMAVTLPNPIVRDPAHPSRGLRRLAGLIERRASRAGGYVGCVQ